MSLYRGKCQAQRDKYHVFSHMFTNIRKWTERKEKGLRDWKENMERRMKTKSMKGRHGL